MTENWESKTEFENSRRFLDASLFNSNAGLTRDPASVGLFGFSLKALVVGPKTRAYTLEAYRLSHLYTIACTDHKVQSRTLGQAALELRGNRMTTISSEINILTHKQERETVSLWVSAIRPNFLRVEE